MSDIFFGILYCFVYTFVFFNLHIYISGELIAHYFFYAGFFSGAPWKVRDGTTAAPAMGVSIHTLGVFRSTGNNELPTPSNTLTQAFQVLFLDGR